MHKEESFKSWPYRIDVENIDIIQQFLLNQMNSFDKHIRLKTDLKSVFNCGDK